LINFIIRATPARQQLRPPATLCVAMRAGLQALFLTDEICSQKIDGLVFLIFCFFV